MTDSRRRHGVRAANAGSGSNPVAWHRLLQSCLALAGAAPMTQLTPTPLHRPAAGSLSDAAAPTETHHYRRPSVLSSWIWFIGKNVLGWILILSSFVIGPAL